MYRDGGERIRRCGLRTMKGRYINKDPNATAGDAKSRQIWAKDRINGGAFGRRTTDIAFLYHPPKNFSCIHATRVV